MAQVCLNLNGRSYRFSCDDAEVPRVTELSAYVKAKFEALSAEHGPVGDERLMLMAALMIADELFDARADIDGLLDTETDKLKAVAEGRSPDSGEHSGGADAESGA